MKRETRCVYARGNLLIKKFRHWSDDVNVKLFKSYCSSFYCCYLWAKFHYKCRSKLVVVYKQILFIILSHKGTTSHMINATIDSYDVILHTYLYSLILYLTPMIMPLLLLLLMLCILDLHIYTSTGQTLVYNDFIEQ